MLCAVLFVTFLDNTVVSVALADIQSGLHAGVTSLQWVVNGYALAFASAMLACGMIGDELGRKRVMLSGLGVFCAGSLMCALAPSPGVLIGGRVLMGLGAAASEPGTLSLLRHIYPEADRRARAVGTWAATSGLALAAGPVVGGLLTGAGGWRAVFWFNLAFGACVLAVAAATLPESADPDARRVDTAGALIGAATLAALVFGIIGGETVGFTSARSLALYALAAVGAVVWVLRERRAARPLVDLRYFRVPGFSTANAAAFCIYFAVFAVFFFTALYLVEVVGDGSVAVAGTFAPMAALMVASALLAGRAVDRIGPRWLVAGGCAAFGAGLLLTEAALGPSPAEWELVLALAITGAGIGTTVVPVTTSVLAAVPAERSGMAASSTNTSREIGAVTGVAVLGAVVNHQLTSHLTAALVRLGIPANFQSIVITGVETGALPSGGKGAGAAGGAAAAGNAGLVQQVIHAAYNAFGVGLDTSLTVSAVLVLAAGLLGALTLRRPAPTATSAAAGAA